MLRRDVIKILSSISLTGLLPNTTQDIEDILEKILDKYPPIYVLSEQQVADKPFQKEFFGYATFGFAILDD